MSGVLGGGSVLSEEHSIDYEQVTIADRVRHLDLEPDPGATLKEATQILRDALDLFQSTTTEGWERRYNTSVIVQALLFRYQHVISEGDSPVELGAFTVIDLLEQEEPHGFLRAAELLEDIRIAVEGSVFPADAELMGRLSATVVRSRRQWPEEVTGITCDGDQMPGVECLHRSPRLATEEEAIEVARWNGWLVSEEKDLCPAHCQHLGVTPPPPLNLEDALSPFGYHFFNEANKAWRSGISLEQFVQWVRELASEQISRYVKLRDSWYENYSRDLGSPFGYALAALDQLSAPVVVADST